MYFKIISLYVGACHGIVKSQIVFVLFVSTIEPRKWLYLLYVDFNVLYLRYLDKHSYGIERTLIIFDYH